MTEATAVLESSPEVPIMEVERGPLVNLTPDERKEFRTTGNLPTPKKEESATSSEPDKGASAGESETPKTQEKPKIEPKPKKTAEERILELESTIEKIKKGAGLEKPKAASEPAKTVAPKIADRPKEDDYTTHSEYEEAVLDWKLEKREVEKAVKERESANLKALNDKIEEARSRYENLEAVIQPTADAIIKDEAISPAVKQMIGESEVVADLLYTLGGSKEELASFMELARSNPGKALRYVALTESLIAQELESKKTPVSEEVPVKPKTNAPKPPIEAGGRAATPPDSMQAALEGSGGKLTSSVRSEFMRQALAKMKS